MDIEKVIAYAHAKSAPAVRDMENSDTFTDWSSGIGTLLPKADVRALLTEIDYWRARCGAAEAVLLAHPIHNIDTEALSLAIDAHKSAVWLESDKARFLEGLQETKASEIYKTVFPEGGDGPLTATISPC